MMSRGSVTLVSGHVVGRGPRPLGHMVILVMVHDLTVLPDVVIMSISRVLLLPPCLQIGHVHYDEGQR